MPLRCETDGQTLQNTIYIMDVNVDVLCTCGSYGSSVHPRVVDPLFLSLLQLSSLLPKTFFPDYLQFTRQIGEFIVAVQVMPW